MLDLLLTLIDIGLTVYLFHYWYTNERAKGNL